MHPVLHREQGGEAGVAREEPLHHRHAEAPALGLPALDRRRELERVAGHDEAPGALERDPDGGLERLRGLVDDDRPEGPVPQEVRARARERAADHLGPVEDVLDDAPLEGPRPALQLAGLPEEVAALAPADAAARLSALLAELGRLELDAPDLLVVGVLAHLHVEREVEEPLADAGDVARAHDPQAGLARALGQEVDGDVGGRTHE